LLAASDEQDWFNTISASAASSAVQREEAIAPEDTLAWPQIRIRVKA
jgi:hypothetical protein